MSERKEGEREREGGREGSVLSVADSVTHACPPSLRRHCVCLGNQQMFLSITNFRETGVSQHEPGGQGQESEVSRLGLRAS